MTQGTMFGYMVMETFGFLLAWVATESAKGAAMLWGGLHAAAAFVVAAGWGLWELAGLIARLAA